jgi:hypothetical protein
MGWWETEYGLIGDDILDCMDGAVEEIAKLYLQEHGRKPTLQELLEAFRLTLNADAEAISDFDGEITQLTTKSKTRKRRSRLKPGDVFSVPLEDELFAFGRLTPQFGVAEFFRVKSRKRVRAQQLIQYPTFRLEAMVSEKPFKDGSWVIYDAVEYPADSFEPSPYRMGNVVACGHDLVNGFIDTTRKVRPASEQEMQTVPALSVNNQAMTELELRAALVDAPEVD